MLESRKLLSGGALVPGVIVSSSIATIGQQDEWTFNGNAGGTVTIGMNGANGFSPRADIYEPGAQPGTLGAFIRTLSPVGAGPVALDQDGEYTLVVRDYSNKHTGSYTLSLEGINPISPNPTPLITGGIVGGTIDSALDVKQFTFSVPDNSDITLGMTGALSGFSVRGDLYGPGSSDIIKTISPGQAPQKLHLAQGGTYMLDVHDYSYNHTGSFTIGLEGVNPISPNPTPLITGGIVGGKIDSALDVKQFTFSVPDNSDITLGMTGAASGFSVRGDLYGPGSNTIIKTLSPGQPPARIHFSEGGTYMLYVYDYSYNHIGSFTIGLEGINPISPDSLQLKPGGILRGSIDAALDVDELTFDGVAGQGIGLAATSAINDSGFSARFDLISPSGEVKTFSESGGQHAYTLQDTGKYLLYVYDYAYTHRGYYTIGFESFNPPGFDPKILPNGVARSGSLSTMVAIDQYVLNLAQNDQLSITLASASGASGFSPRIDVYGPTGAFVETWGPETNSLTAKDAGSYLLQVRDYSLKHTGKYTLSAKLLSPKVGGISGTLYSDNNGNGKRETTEPGIAAATVFIDTNKNGKRDSGEQTATTDSDGVYAFTRLRAGTYVVRPLRPSGFAAPAPTSLSYTLKAGQCVGNANFGAVPGQTISGSLFADDNKNGKLDTLISEDSLFGWTIFIDTDGDNVLDSNERSTTTDVNGNWSFNNMKAGNYTIRAVVNSPWKLTTPTKPMKITLAAKKSSTGNSFGVARIA
jgi:hypothetical protein